MAVVFILTFFDASAKKPPGYVETPKEVDPNPPKYEYGYRIQEDKTAQGKDEQRDGVYAQGRYYVENGTDSKQNVQYFADDWGYHPVVEYSNVGPHSKSAANFVLGEEAIKLKNKQQKLGSGGEVDDPGTTAPPVEPQQPPAKKQPLFFVIQPQQELVADDLLPRSLSQLFIKTDPQPAPLLVQYPDDSTAGNGENGAPQATPAALVRVTEEITSQDDTNFGAKLTTPTPSLNNKLIESTKHLVSGDDVLDINAALSQSGNGPIESSTLQSLLHRHVTPTIVGNGLDQAPSVTSTPTPSLLTEPIVVADLQDDQKPVTEPNVDDDVPTVSASASTEAQVVVTPRPAHSHFLAPEDQQQVLVQVQKTIPYYLGMYQYPHLLETGRNLSGHEQSAVENIELGKTLLYFPVQEAQKTEQLVQQPNAELETNELSNQPVAKDQSQADSIEQTEYIHARPSNNIPDNYYQRLPVPNQQFYALSQPAAVQLSVPYFLGNVAVDRKVPHQHYADKPVTRPIATYPPVNSQPILLQIPGLYSPQKYSTLVRNSLRHHPQQVRLHGDKAPQRHLQYAPQNNQYLPAKPHTSGYKRPQGGLKKLNLLVFPRANVPLNLPPVTKDLHKEPITLEQYRHSGAQLNNGYLPPNENKFVDAKLNEEHSVGLVPPKTAASADDGIKRQRSGRSFFDEKSIRLEYGFMPPMVPSLEIDEYGRPIERDDNKN